MSDMNRFRDAKLKIAQPWEYINRLWEPPEPIKATSLLTIWGILKNVKKSESGYFQIQVIVDLLSIFTTKELNTNVIISICLNS